MAVPRVDDKHEDHYHHAPDQTELEKVLKRGREKVQPYGKQLIAALLILTVVVVITIVWWMQTNRAQQAGWDQFLNAAGAEDLEAVADKNPNTTVAYWSRLQAGRMYVQEGLGSVLSDRSTSDERLNKAKGMFQKLVDAGNKVPSEVREEALYGLATALEALSDGDTQTAIKAYEALLKEFPKSNHRLWVEARIKELQAQESQQFYAWFRQTTPKPEDRNLPFDLQGIMPPPEDGQIPDINIELDDELIKQIGGGLQGDNAPLLPPMNPPILPETNNPEQDSPSSNPEQDPPSSNPEQNSPSSNPEQNPPTGDTPPAAENPAPLGEAPVENPQAPAADNPPAGEQPAGNVPPTGDAPAENVPPAGEEPAP